MGSEKFADVVVLPKQSKETQTEASVTVRISRQATGLQRENCWSSSKSAVRRLFSHDSLGDAGAAGS